MFAVLLFLNYHILFVLFMAQNGLLYADVPLRNYLLAVLH